LCCHGKSTEQEAVVVRKPYKERDRLENVEIDIRRNRAQFQDFVETAMELEIPAKRLSVS
jgi:hypothetical protein